MQKMLKIGLWPYFGFDTGDATAVLNVSSRGLFLIF